jgi:hypothetical protein
MQTSRCNSEFATDNSRPHVYVTLKPYLTPGAAQFQHLVVAFLAKFWHIAQIVWAILRGSALCWCAPISSIPSLGRDLLESYFLGMERAGRPAPKEILLSRLVILLLKAWPRGRKP